MKEKSLTKNTIFYLIYNVLNILFPFATGIYVARILSPETVGAVTYAQNIVQYFVIFAFLGIPTYGMREIAKNRKDKVELDKLFTELFLVNLISTIFFICIYLIVIFTVDIFRNNIELYLVVGILLILNALNITWLFEGEEDFTFISIRNIIFKVVSFILLVLIVKRSEDSLLYACINVIGTAGNYIINMICHKKYANFTFKNLHFKRHLKPIIYLVAVNLAIELYTMIDVTMIGTFYANEFEKVAYYSYASRINQTLKTIINTFTIVLIPRISLYCKEKKEQEYNELLSKTLVIIVLFALPMIVGLYFVSDNMIEFLYSNVYIESSKILKVLSVLLIISPIGYLLGSRVLLVNGKENQMIIPVSIGAVVNVILNFVLINQLGPLGVAIASVVSEVVVMIVYVSLGKKFFHLTKIKGSIIKIIISSIIMGFVLFALSLIDIENNLLLVIQILIGMLVYFLSLLFLREKVSYEFIKNIKKLKENHRKSL